MGWQGNQLIKGVVSRSGKWIVIPGKWGFTGDFSNDLVAVWINEKVGFMNTKGEIVIAPSFSDYSRNSSFEEGLIAVYIKKQDKEDAGFIDTKGNWIIRPHFEQAGQFCEGLAPVQIEGKWGYIDKTGKFVIPPIYEHAGSFDAGIAIVHFRDKLGKLREAYINEKGSMIYSNEREVNFIALEPGE
jgi:hypothetical protein